MYADNSVTTVRKNNRESENKHNYELQPNKTISLPWWPYPSWQKTVQNTKNIEVVAWSGLEKSNIIKDLHITTVIKTGIRYISAVQETTIRNLAESGMWAPGHSLRCLLCHFETYFRYSIDLWGGTATNVMEKEQSDAYRSALPRTKRVAVNPPNNLKF